MGEKVFTREQFDKAVENAQREFMDISLSEKDNAEVKFTVMVMSLQNSAFATLIYKHLFGEEPSK